MLFEFNRFNVENIFLNCIHTFWSLAFCHWRMWWRWMFVSCCYWIPEHCWTTLMRRRWSHLTMEPGHRNHPLKRRPWMGSWTMSIACYFVDESVDDRLVDRNLHFSQHFHKNENRFYFVVCMILNKKKLIR